METVSTSETSVSLCRLHGTISQNTVIFTTLHSRQIFMHVDEVLKYAQHAGGPAVFHSYSVWFINCAFSHQITKSCLLPSIHKATAWKWNVMVTAFSASWHTATDQSKWSPGPSETIMVAVTLVTSTIFGHNKRKLKLSCYFHSHPKKSTFLPDCAWVWGCGPNSSCSG
jgi:hypothetical protein